MEGVKTNFILFYFITFLSLALFTLVPNYFLLYLLLLLLVLLLLLKFNMVGII